MSAIVGILLAAGSSKRFGADKLAQRLPNGVPVAVQACRNLLAGTDQVLAIVNSGSQTLAEYLQAEGAEVQVCADAGQGMGVSLAYGIRAKPDAFGWLVALADMPCIAPTTIMLVADALRSGALIAAPSWQGQRGHPVGFAQNLGPELSLLSGDSGAKALIQAHKGQLALLNCADPGILQDIDEPEDLANLSIYGAVQR